MSSGFQVTTSWDDGHPNDLRLADLLRHYGLAATFYVPRQGPVKTMSPPEIRELSADFEIGAHTMSHIVLVGSDPRVARIEIESSKKWIEDVAGHSCRMFCPPEGRFNREHVAAVRAAGYLGMRTVELTSISRPSVRDGLMLVPTTLQAYPHATSRMVRNAVKRLSLGNMVRALRTSAAGSWADLAQTLVARAQAEGGVFHLWGHSWELGAVGWDAVADVFKLLSEASASRPSCTNGHLCEIAWATQRKGGE